MQDRDPDYASSAFKASPHEHWALLRRDAPAQSVRLRNGAKAWRITRYDDAVTVLSDPRLAKDPLKAKSETAASRRGCPALSAR